MDGTHSLIASTGATVLPEQGAQEVGESLAEPAVQATQASSDEARRFQPSAQGTQVPEESSYSVPSC